MSGAVETAKPLGKLFWVTQALFLLYFAAALGCLRQWGTANPWSRLDRFCGGYLLLGLLWVRADVRWHRAIFRSREVMEEASGASFDPGLLRAIAVLYFAEPVVFLDYGHWHLVPALEQPALQWLGLVLYLAGALWLFWVDTYLAQQFLGDLQHRNLITEGPYRYLRHPRYAGLISSRIAFALALASLLGWLAALAWLGILLRRIHLEEIHLHELFGADYEAYAARTVRLLPGIY